MKYLKSFLNFLATAFPYVTSIAALIISIQSNNLSKEAQTPKVALIEPKDKKMLVDGEKCLIGGDSRSAHYYLNVLGLQSFTIENNGGNATSLVSVKFTDNNNDDYKVYVYDMRKEDKFPTDEIDFPIAIESGHALSISVLATHNDRGLSFYNNFSDEIFSLHASPPNGTWFFNFLGNVSIIEPTVGEGEHLPSHTSSCDSDLPPVSKDG